MFEGMKRLGPIDYPSLIAKFERLAGALLELLEGLSPEDWHKPTVHTNRDVKDLAAHLLDTALRRLSMQRDGYFVPAGELRTFEDLVAFIQRANREWMIGARRVSPRILIQMMRQTEIELVDLMRGLDPEGTAIFSVAWAGEETSKNWFDIARELTERWHHQQQIRDAVGAPHIMTRDLLGPVLDTFVRGAPHAYRAVEAPEGTSIRFVIDGEAGGEFFMLRESDAWHMVVPEGARAPQASVWLDQDAAWRLWTKGLTAEQAHARMDGPEAWTNPILHMVSIMA